VATRGGPDDRRSRRAASIFRLRGLSGFCPTAAEGGGADAVAVSTAHLNTTPYWPEAARLPILPPLRRDLAVDVAVIGGGITGATAAYLFKKAGATVALLERGRCATAETGHTTAHLTYVTDSRLSQLVSRFGRDHAQATWDAGLAAMNQIEQLMKEERIRCEFSWVPGFLHAPPGRKRDEEEKDALQEDARFAQEFGFDAAFVEDVPFVGGPGVRFGNQAKFHPVKYVAGLLRAIRGGGSHVFENSEVSAIQEGPLLLKANGYEVRCKFVFIATHVPLQGATGTVRAALFQTKLAPYSTYAVGAKIPSGVIPEASFWDTGDPYFYLRIDRRKGYDYAILGGADHKTGQVHDPAKCYSRVEKRLSQLFPQSEIVHRWSGQVIETTDGLPFMGETAPGQFVATGFSGNGMTLGTLSAMMACDAFHQRENPWRALFDVGRKTLSSAWDYLKENKDYPYYMLKEMMAKRPENATRAIKRGEGKVVMHEGARVAAFRNEKGKLCLKSAICPHMGCVVRWNAAEKTWDCPCHGSRFRATGEVMAGPAETDLADAGA
jgi:glycine/D-amino acid oxidase-like deaminating enzyme/nitrite reductase/ring-hydroxylating ferredoxin subunit